MSLEEATTDTGFWRQEERGCPICGGEARVSLGRRGGGAHHRGIGEAASVVRCLHCDCVYCFPTLLPEGNPYDAHAAADYFGKHDLGRKKDAGRALAIQAEKLLGARGRLLELGCGSGALLEGAASWGWVVRGVDQTPGFAKNAKVEVELASVESCRSLEEEYDAILLAAILEHLYEPVACLNRVQRALRPGGVVFIDVPNELSLWHDVGNRYFSLRGLDWVTQLSPTFPPYHVVGFSPTSLRRALDLAGLEVVSLRTHRWQNDLPKKPGLRPWAERLASGLILSIGQKLGRGLGITCWARRPHSH